MDPPFDLSVYNSTTYYSRITDMFVVISQLNKLNVVFGFHLLEQQFALNSHGSSVSLPIIFDLYYTKITH